jgi:hypothetical protein
MAIPGLYRLYPCYVDYEPADRDGFPHLSRNSPAQFPQHHRKLPAPNRVRARTVIGPYVMAKELIEAGRLSEAKTKT